ncbi:MAG TPA: DUF4252 domain-containing protein [Chryseosolibacter sp.]
MKLKFFLFVFFLAIASQASAQSKTTEALEKKYSDALKLFFYNNTLRMLNQQNDPNFDELIKNIEKMKFLLIRKDEKTFANGGYKQIVSDYKKEAFEEIMTSRFEGKNFDVFLKEKDGKTKGMLVLVNDKESLYVLDILGSININKVTDLYSTLDKSSDIGKQIKAFTDQGKDDEDDDDEERVKIKERKESDNK